MSADLTDLTQTSPGVTQTSPGTGSSTLVDSTHPYFFHASDTPEMVLINTPFNGRGYRGWSRSILISLSAKNKLGFIDGSCPTPAITHSDLKIWNGCNDMVTSWLLNSLTKRIADSVFILKQQKTSGQIWSTGLDNPMVQNCTSYKRN